MILQKIWKIIGKRSLITILLVQFLFIGQIGSITMLMNNNIFHENNDNNLDLEVTNGTSDLRLRNDIKNMNSIEKLLSNSNMTEEGEAIDSLNNINIGDKISEMGSNTDSTSNNTRRIDFGTIRMQIQEEEYEGFVWRDVPVEVDLGTTYNSWVEQDLSAIVPSDASGVILYWVANDVADVQVVAKGTEDTNNYLGYNLLKEKCWRMQIVKLDSNLCIDTWRPSNTPSLFVMGYTSGSDPQFKTIPSDLGSLTTANAWTSITVSGLDTDTTGIIIFTQATGGTGDDIINVRAVGSNNPQNGILERRWKRLTSNTFFIKIDSSDQFEYYRGGAILGKFYLIAEIKNTVDWLDTNEIDISEYPKDHIGWFTRDLDSYITVPSYATGVILAHEKGKGNIAREFGQEWEFPYYDLDKWAMGGSKIDSEDRIEIHDNDKRKAVTILIQAITLLKMTPPIITLHSPDNDTSIETSSVINLDITDYSLENVWFNWDDGINQSIVSPYQIAVPSGEGYHWLTVCANDSVGLLTVKKYRWWINQVPTINLLSPANNSIQKDGTIIILTVEDNNLDDTWYSWDDGENQSFVANWNLTFDLTDGWHLLNVYTNDTSGSLSINQYYFYCEADSPLILLINPENDSIITSATSIGLNITDFSPITVWYQWDHGNNLSLSDPWQVNPPSTEGIHWLTVYTEDSVGHVTVQKYRWTILIPTTTTTSSIPVLTSGFELLPLLMALLGIITILRRARG